MHRGSSKDVRETPRAAGILPLSASSSSTVVVKLDLTRGGSVDHRRLTVSVGTPVRAALRSVGQSPEGSAVLEGETPIPLDTPIDRPMRLIVVSTFSGG